MAAFRSIAVTVEESEEGGFIWLLLEHTVEWTPLKCADRPTKSYAKAMADGLLALQALVTDLDVGPREADVETAQAKHKTFGFGFGLLK